MPMTQTTFKTITTRLYSTEEAEVTNQRHRAFRLEDLNNYGRHGYALVNTVTAPEHDGITIIDTLALTEQH